MEIIIGKTSGFCFGVENAVNKTAKALEDYGNISILGELVHNSQVTSSLEAKGLNIIDDISKARGKAVIRAHGEKIDTYKKAEELGIELIDLTCPKVKRIHQIAEEYSSKGYYIFLIGHKTHPETIGTISYCGSDCSIIENEEDIKNGLETFNKSQKTKLLIIVQTTFNLETFNNIVNFVKEKTEGKNIELEIKNTICHTTRLRQEETKKIAKEVEAMIVIGGKQSSNTNKLFDIAEKYCKYCILIETYNEINIKEIKKYQVIGVIAGASTPQKSIDEVVEFINKLC